MSSGNIKVPCGALKRLKRLLFMSLNLQCIPQQVANIHGCKPNCRKFGFIQFLRGHLNFIVYYYNAFKTPGPVLEGCFSLAVLCGSRTILNRKEKSLKTNVRWFECPLSVKPFKVPSSCNPLIKFSWACRNPLSQGFGKCKV